MVIDLNYEKLLRSLFVFVNCHDMSLYMITNEKNSSWILNIIVDESWDFWYLFEIL